jgi:AMP nucleosidase
MTDEVGSSAARLWDGFASEMTAFTDAGAAVARIGDIYAASIASARQELARLLRGEPASPALARIRYPYLSIAVGADDVDVDPSLAYGAVFDPGA